jgi:hypothetical protein
MYTMLSNRESLAKLQAYLPIGSTVYTMVRHISASGMSKRISAFTVVNGEIVDIDYLLIRAELGKTRGDKQGLYVTGVNLSLEYHLVHNLGRTLHSDGYALKQISL